MALKATMKLTSGPLLAVKTMLTSASESRRSRFLATEDHVQAIDEGFLGPVHFSPFYFRLVRYFKDVDASKSINRNEKNRTIDQH